VNIIHALGRAIAEFELWSAGDRVAVAVSGGGDSVALLHLLVETAGWHGGILSVAHFDHGIRPDSGDHAAWVGRLAENLGLPFHLGEARLGPVSEDAARTARYAFFEALAADRVALAHHQQDQAETVLFRLIRGTGPAGLAGIPRVRDRFVRPLLDFPPAQLRAWLVERQLAWLEDPSNADPRHTRNRVRHEVLPLLESIRPGATAGIARTAAAIAETPPFDPTVRAPVGAWRLAPRQILAALRSRISGITLADVDEVRHLLNVGAGSVRLGPHAEIRVTDGYVALYLATNADDGDVVNRA
jgi:tRNA(Ile)-lysidine synthetase-like protein